MAISQTKISVASASPSRFTLAVPSLHSSACLAHFHLQSQLPRCYPQSLGADVPTSKPRHPSQVPRAIYASQWPLPLSLLLCLPLSASALRVRQ
jgi:hypothetical protein